MNTITAKVRYLKVHKVRYLCYGCGGGGEFVFLFSIVGFFFLKEDKSALR
jgi:hypothetical protein